MERKSTFVINLFAGPGSGKSTLMAGIFSNLKNRGINCEMAPEYAKEKTWEASKILDNQIYVFAKQHHRIIRLLGDVDVIITDSPLLLSLYYGNNNTKEFRDLILSEFNTMANINFFVERVKPYNPKGRSQTEEEARQIDLEIKKILSDSLCRFESVKGEAESIEIVSSLIIDRLNAQKSDSEADRKDRLQKKTIKWLCTSPNIGMSSKTMAFYIAFGEISRDNFFPVDPSDFNRCLLFLNEVPEARPDIYKLADLNSYWASLAKNWDQLEKMFLEEAGLNFSKKTRAVLTSFALNHIINSVRHPSLSERDI